jgi:hypothetical protein
MEGMAITLLTAVLFTGVVVMLIFVQFLAVGRESHERFQEISAELRSIARKLNGPAAGEAKPEGAPGPRA